MPESSPGNCRLLCSWLGAGIDMAPPGDASAAANVLVSRAGRLSVRALASIVKGLPVVLPSAVDAALALCNKQLDAAAAADHPLM